MAEHEQTRGVYDAKITKSLQTAKEFILFLGNHRAESFRDYTLFIYISIKGIKGREGWKGDVSFSTNTS